MLKFCIQLLPHFLPVWPWNEIIKGTTVAAMVTPVYCWIFCLSNWLDIYTVTM